MARGDPNGEVEGGGQGGGEGGCGSHEVGRVCSRWGQEGKVFSRYSLAEDSSLAAKNAVVGRGAYNI